MSEAREMATVVSEARETAEELIDMATREADKTRFMFFMPRSWKEGKLYEARKYLVEAEKLIASIETREKDRASRVGADDAEAEAFTPFMGDTHLTIKQLARQLESRAYDDVMLTVVQAAMKGGDSAALRELVRLSLELGLDWRDLRLQTTDLGETLEAAEKRTSVIKALLDDFEEWEEQQAAKAKEEREQGNENILS